MVALLIAESFVVRLDDCRREGPDPVLDGGEGLPAVIVIEPAEQLKGIDTTHTWKVVSQPFSGARRQTIGYLSFELVDLFLPEGAGRHGISLDDGDFIPVLVGQHEVAPEIGFVRLV